MVNSKIIRTRKVSRLKKVMVMYKVLIDTCIGLSKSIVTDLRRQGQFIRVELFTIPDLKNLITDQKYAHLLHPNFMMPTLQKSIDLLGKACERPILYCQLLQTCFSALASQECSNWVTVTHLMQLQTVRCYKNWTFSTWRCFSRTGKAKSSCARHIACHVTASILTVGWFWVPGFRKHMYKCFIGLIRSAVHVICIKIWPMGNNSQIYPQNAWKHPVADILYI